MIANRICGALTATAAGTVAIGLGVMTGASAATVGIALGIAASLGAFLVRDSRSLGVGAFGLAMRTGLESLRNYGAMFALSHLARSLVNDPGNIPGALASYTGAICSVARFISALAPIVMKIQIVATALSLAYLAGVGASAAING